MHYPNVSLRKVLTVLRYILLALESSSSQCSECPGSGSNQAEPGWVFVSDSAKQTRLEAGPHDLSRFRQFRDSGCLQNHLIISKLKLLEHLVWGKLFAKLTHKQNPTQQWPRNLPCVVGDVPSCLFNHSAKPMGSLNAGAPRAHPLVLTLKILC